MKPSYFFKNIDKRLSEVFSNKNVWETINRKLDIEREINGQVINSHVGKAHIGEGTIVKHSTIEDNVYIGDNCTIGPNAFIRKNSIILDNCHVGRAEVKNSILMKGVRAHHTSHILDSIIGENCNIAAQFTTANLRFDNKNVKIKDKDTGLRKFGVIMGDNVKTGIMSSTMPGTLIGPESVIFPGKTAQGFYQKKSRIR